MALRVWLPLDRDLRQLGCSNVTVTSNTNTAIQNDGKIGKCYHPVAVNLTDLNNLTFDNSSFCFWAKTSSTSTWQLIIGIDNTDLSQIHGIYVADSSRLKLEYNPSLNVYNSEIAQWHHYAFIVKNGNSQVYYDGVLKATSGEAVTNDTIGRLRLGVGTAISLNDVRIYDNCLSAAEVKEIAQGLILHYKLDGGLFGNPNLYTGSEKFTGTWNGMGNWATSSETYQNFVVKQRSGAWGGLSQNIPCTQGDIFTISFYGKVESGGTIGSIHRSNLGNVTTGLTILNGNFIAGQYWIRATDDGTQWKRYWATVQITGSDITYLQWRLENSVANKNFYICGIKLEKGNAATPWCPADSEMNIDRTIIEDSSGYNHNGIINGNMSINSNTAKYNNAIVFNGSDNAIQIPFNDIIKTDDYTISVWTYKETIGTKSYQTILGGPSGFELEARSGSSTSPLYRIHNWGGGTTAYEFNKWNLFTFVRTINDSKLYVNGELKLTGTAGTIPTGNYFIGAWSNTTKQNYEGLMSDFRIYCTPLLDTDVKQLYNIGMKVDNFNNSHPFEINEFNINKIAKTGILFDQIIEPYLTLPDGSKWKLMLYHYVDYGNNLFTSSNASYCNDLGLYSRLNKIQNYSYDGKYEYYVIQDDKEFRWTQTSSPIATSISGLTTVSGYLNPVNGLAKPTSLTQTYIGYNSWWGACGCWTSYSVGGKTGIPGFGSHDKSSICEKYLALYTRITEINFKLKNGFVEANEFIER